jgi:hypothetical protein
MNGTNTATLGTLAIALSTFAPSPQPQGFIVAPGIVEQVQPQPRFRLSTSWDLYAACYETLSALDELHFSEELKYGIFVRVILPVAERPSPGKNLCEQLRHECNSWVNNVFIPMFRPSENVVEQLSRLINLSDEEKATVREIILNVDLGGPGKLDHRVNEAIAKGQGISIREAQRRRKKLRQRLSR